jgi:ferredoxin
MNIRKTLKSALLPVFLLLIIAFFSNRVSFYHFDTALRNVPLHLQRSTKSEVNGQMLWFTYDNDSIELNLNTFLDPSLIQIYALTAKGSRLLDPSTLSLGKDCTGSIAAIAPPYQFDNDNDGKADIVYIAAKTDTQLTQGAVPVKTQFANSKLPFELVLSNKSTVTVYFKNTPLANQNITMNSTHGANQKMSTDSNGVIHGLDIRDIRNGLNVQYKDNKGTFYNLSYQVENNSLFTARHFSSMKPIFKVVILSAACILIILILRNLGVIKTRLKNRRAKQGRLLETFLHFKFILCRILYLIRKIPITFSHMRWISMIVSFILFVYGIQFFGRQIHAFEIPVFACPANFDQFIESPCYAFSHLNMELTSNAVGMATLFITTLIIIILFGRTLCGFVCPFGLMQDIMYKIRSLLRINCIPLNEKIYSVLNVLKWIMLLLFFGVWAAGINFCDFCPAMITSPAFAGFKTNLHINGYVAVFFLVLSFFKRRIWCNICPLGYFIGLFHKISLFRLRKNCQSCTYCGACYEACPMGIKSIYTEREKNNITSCDCIMCGECIKKCPENDAIALAVLKKKFYVASRFKFFQTRSNSRTIKMPFFHKEL